jgi:DNA polymerase III epsilon subunit-like protein
MTSLPLPLNWKSEYIMPDIPFLSVAFFDFEASSLDLESWPIEVGLSWIDHNLEVQTYHSLIQPVPEWPEHAWSPASAAVHNIPRRALDRTPDVTEVAEDLLKALDGRIALSVAHPFERHWLDRLIAAASVTDHVTIEDFDAITLSAFSSHALDHLYEHLDRTKAPHRAGPDSARCANAWLAGLRCEEER